MIDAYKALVRRLAEKRDPEIISNSSIDHAAVLVSEMFRLGSGEARIFSGALNPSLYANHEVVAAMGAFLSAAGSSVKILVQDGDKAASNAQIFFTKLRERTEGAAVDRVEIRAGDAFAAEQTFHFTTVGDGFFRFEPDREKHEAFASFGRPDHVKNLSGVFDLLWPTATAVVHGETAAA